MLDVLVTSWPILVAMGALLAGSAFFSSAETAVFSISLRDLNVGRARTVRRLEVLIADRKGLLVTILLGNLLVNVLYFNLGVLVSARFAREGATAAAVATSVVALMLIVLLGEIVPKTVAVSWPGIVARFAAGPLWWLQRVLKVPRLLLSFIADAVGRLVVGQREEEGEVDPGELRALLELAAEEGHLKPDEHHALQAVLALSEMQVKDLMVPRVDIVALELDADAAPDAARERVIKLVAEHRLNKIPVYEGSLDRIVGFLDAKEVLARPEAVISDLVRPVVFVPEVSALTGLLERFQKDRARMLIVVDEYGGTEGLLTHEDVVEAVVGDLSDESDRVPSLVEEKPGQWLVDASIGVRALARMLGAGPGALRARTIGGLVTSLLGRFPRIGDSVRAGRVAIEVVSLAKHQPSRVRVRLLRTTQVAREAVQ